MKTDLLPDYVKRYFWGDDLSSLDLQKNQRYITQVILERGDSKAIKWLFETFTKGAVKNLLSTINLSKKSSSFWNVYLS